MKKIVIWLILIIAVALTVFFFGWTQYRLDKDVYGVIHTRTFGYDDTPITSGTFSWSFWALFPQNLEITQIPSKSRLVTVSIEQELPSADLYTIMTIGHPDFSYAADIAIPYAISEQAVVQLVSQYGLNEHTVSSWFIETDMKVRMIAQELLTDMFSTSDQDLSDRSLLSSRISDQLTSGLQSYFPELTIGPIRTSFTRLPDYRLYQKAKSEYEELADLKNRTLKQAIIDAPGRAADDILYIDKLESFGQLLTMYPVLLEYLQIEQRD